MRGGGEKERKRRDLRTILILAIFCLIHFLFLSFSLSFSFITGELGQGKRIYDTIRRVQEGGLGMLSVFGEDREFDYSMLTVRGRYTTTEQLTRYFKVPISITLYLSSFFC